MVPPPDPLKPDQATIRTPLVQAGSCACSGALPEAAYSLGLTAGEVDTVQHIDTYDPHVPAWHLMYNSFAASTQPQPVFIVHFPLDTSHSAAPSTVSAQLTVNSVSATQVYYNTSQLNPGDIMQLTLPTTASAGLTSTGRYSYSITVVENYSTPVTYTYSGSVDVVNDSSSAFGAGWSLDAVERLWPITGSGAILELPGGYSLWFANGSQSGTFLTPVKRKGVRLGFQLKFPLSSLVCPVAVRRIADPTPLPSVLARALHRRVRRGPPIAAGPPVHRPSRPH